MLPSVHKNHLVTSKRNGVDQNRNEFDQPYNEATFEPKSQRNPCFKIDLRISQLFT